MSDEVLIRAVWELYGRLGQTIPAIASNLRISRILVNWAIDEHNRQRKECRDEITG